MCQISVWCREQSVGIDTQAEQDWENMKQVEDGKDIVQVDIGREDWGQGRKAGKEGKSVEVVIWEDYMKLCKGVNFNYTQLQYTNI